MGSDCLDKVVKGDAQWGRVCAAQFNWVTVCTTCGQSEYATILRCSIFAKKKLWGGGGEGWQKSLNWEIKPNILQQTKDLIIKKSVSLKSATVELVFVMSSHYLHKAFV